MFHPKPPPPPAGFYSGYSPGHQPGFQPPPAYGYPPTYAVGPFHPPVDMGAVESGRAGQNFGFSEKSIRMGFIRKVYGILVCQIGVTVGVVALFTFHEGTRVYVQEHPGLWWVAMGFMVGTMLTLVCGGELRRKAPLNFVCLGVFTLAESFFLGSATSMYSAEEVFYAAVLTFVIVVALTVFAFQTKVDFTAFHGVLFVAAVVLMVFGLVCVFFPGKTMVMVYASMGALLFSVFIVVDTQMMVGGDHKYTLSPEEYVFAALTLYLDIINLFLYILTIIGTTGDK